MNNDKTTQKVRKQRVTRKVVRSNKLCFKKIRTPLLRFCDDIPMVRILHCWLPVRVTCPMRSTHTKID